MSDLISLRLKAQELRKQQDFKAALELFRKVYELTKPEVEQWDVWGLVFCLNKLGNYQQALAICEQHYRRFPAFEYLRSQYAQALYYCRVKSATEAELATLQAAFEQVWRLEQNQPSPIFSVKILLAILKKLEEKFSWQEVITWGSKISKEKLDKQGRQFIPQGGKPKTLSADREVWYLRLAKAYLKLNQAPKCLHITQEGLADFPHSIWLKRLQALSLAELDSVSEAIAIYQELIKHKEEPFLWHELAQFYIKKSQWVEAKAYIAQALDKLQKMPTKANYWEVFYDAACILKAVGEVQVSYAHCAAAYQLVAQQGWRVDARLHAAYTQIDRQLLPHGNNLNELLKSIFDYWLQVSDSGQQFTGQIVRILPHGKAGFIETDTKESYYFNLSDVQAPPAAVVTGKKVSFSIKPSFDKVKNRESYKAVKIKLIQ